MNNHQDLLRHESKDAHAESKAETNRLQVCISRCIMLLCPLDCNMGVAWGS